MTLYSPAERTSNPLNGSGNMTDAIGTINPAALNSGVSASQANLDPNNRGLKRSRSPDAFEEYNYGDVNDDQKPRKRGRPAKTPRTSADFTHDQSGALPTPSSQASPGSASTPYPKSQAAAVQPVATPTQASPPPKSTPKSTLKALPTVRDHTSDQLGPGGDEYIAREYDPDGQAKVDDMGYLQGGREYKIRTFTLPGRGEKLFMLATECARTLQYRDSYLLFNKNRSLFKIIASPKEKEELVAHDILPYSYRSRQIAIVTARSMFRQFGSRVIKDGRRVRDDYWEAKAKKQGFTEEDAAGEKRPGAARAREAAAAEALGNRQLQMYGNIVYANDSNTFAHLQAPPMPPGIASTMPSMPLMESHEARYRDVIRPRQELTGPAYTDLTRTSSDAEMVSQSAHAADYSKNVNFQAKYRRGLINDYWHRPHDPPVTTPHQQVVEPVTTQSLQSPIYDNIDASQPSIVVTQQSTPTPMNPPSFPHAQNPMASPSRQTHGGSRDFTQSHMSTIPRQSSGLHNVESASPTLPNYPYSPLNAQQQQQQPWGQPPPQPQPSPRNYNPQTSPHLQQTRSPMPGGLSQSPIPQQHPQQMQPPQMYQQGSSGGMPGGQQLFGPGQAMRLTAGYPNMTMQQQASMYQQMANQGHFMQQQQQHHQGGQPQQGNWGNQQWQQNF